MIKGKINVPGKGYFDVSGSYEEEYPGIDVEFVPDGLFKGTAPRIVFEWPEGKPLRLLVWGNPNMEDPSQIITFDVGN